MASGASDLALHVARWVGLGGVLLGIGVLVFRRFVWVAGLRRDDVPEVVQRIFAARSRSLLIGAWVLSTGATLVALVAEPGYAPVDALRLGLVAVLFGLALAADEETFQRRPAAPILEAASVAGLVLAAALAGHVRGSSPLIPNLAAAMVHVAAGAAWAGGLVTLIVAALPSSRSLDHGRRLAVLAPMVSRFSTLAVVAVLSVVASGTYSSWVEVRTVGGLTGSAYGLVLLTKLGALIPALAIGGVNNRWTTRRLARAASTGAADETSMGTLRRLVAWEITLLIALLGLTAFLLSLEPPVREL